MSASEASKFEELTLESNDQQRTADLKSGIVSIDYYEDILSPTVTAKVRVVNTGDSIAPKDPNDSKKTDGPRQSIYNGLPLRGGERLLMNILDEGKQITMERKKLDLISHQILKNICLFQVLHRFFKNHREKVSYLI